MRILGERSCVGGNIGHLQPMSPHPVLSNPDHGKIAGNYGPAGASMLVKSL